MLAGLASTGQRDCSDRRRDGAALRVQDAEVWTRWTGLVLVVAIGGAGCSAAHHEAAIRGAVTGPAACSVLTAGDAARVLGGPVAVNPTLNPALHVAHWNCFYIAANTTFSTKSTPSALSLQLDTSTATELARMFRSRRAGTERVVVVPPATKPPASQLRVKVISGLGDEALSDSQSLQIRLGNRLLIVTAEMHGVPDLDGSIAAARLALQRLASP